MFFCRLKISAKSIFPYSAAFMVALSCGKLTDASAETRYSTVNGKQIYEKLCASCHGSKGFPPYDALVLYDPAPRPLLSGSFAYGETKQDIFNTISEGKGRNMLSFRGRLTPPQIEAVADYVITLKDKLASQQEQSHSGPRPSTPEPIEAETPAPPQ